MLKAQKDIKNYSNMQKEKPEIFTKKGQNDFRKTMTQQISNIEKVDDQNLKEEGIMNVIEQCQLAMNDLKGKQHEEVNILEHRNMILTEINKALMDKIQKLKNYNEKLEGLE